MNPLKRTKRLIHSLVFLVAMPAVLSVTQHEYYVSVTTVEFAKEHEAVQIISQIFIDDFEKLIRKRFDSEIVLAVENESEKVSDYMNRYLQTKLLFEINGQKQDFIFLGKRYDEDIVYCYLEIENIKEVKSMNITNNILYDLYEEQENIVRTKINSKNKSFILTQARNKAVLNFN